MLEQALMIPVIIMVFFMFVDLLMFSYRKSVLRAAAREIAFAVEVAPNLDYDLRELTPENAEYYDFYEGRRRATQRGLQLARAVFGDPESSSPTKLIASKQRDTALANYTLAEGEIPELDSAVLVLRPGETGEFRYKADDGSETVEEVSHRDLAPDINGRLPSTRMPSLLNLFPVQVELRAQMKPIVFGLFTGPVTIRASSMPDFGKGIRRTPLPAPPGEELEGAATATRRTQEPEEFVPAPAPEEPVSVCVDGPLLNSAWTISFQRSLTSFPRAAWVINTLSSCSQTKVNNLPNGSAKL